MHNAQPSRLGQVEVKRPARQLIYSRNEWIDTWPFAISPIKGLLGNKKSLVAGGSL